MIGIIVQVMKAINIHPKPIRPFLFVLLFILLELKEIPVRTDHIAMPMNNTLTIFPGIGKSGAVERCAPITPRIVASPKHKPIAVWTTRICICEEIWSAFKRLSKNSLIPSRFLRLFPKYPTMGLLTYYLRPYLHLARGGHLRPVPRKAMHDQLRRKFPVFR